jgi:hypothetical protein
MSTGRFLFRCEVAASAASRVHRHAQQCGRGNRLHVQKAILALLIR